MGLVITGASVVTPSAIGLEQLAFFVRAGADASAAGELSNEQGDPWREAHCPWLEPTLALPDRFVALARAAVQELSEDLDRAIGIVLPEIRAGMSDADLDGVAQRVAQAAQLQGTERFRGAAGVFEALQWAEQALAGEKEAVMILAVDSFISPAAVAEFHRTSSSPWDADLPRPAECATALMVTTEATASARHLTVLARVEQVAIARGTAHDDNDEPVDGVALTELIQTLARPAPFTAVYGPFGVGALRQREWDLAAPRTVDRFASECALHSIETDVGSVGAAAGALQLAYAVAAARHGAWPASAPAPGPSLAWAISADGVRGACALEPVSGAASAEQPPIHVAMSHQPQLLQPPTEEAPLDAARASLVDVIVSDCLERTGSLARDCTWRPLAERPDTERRLWAQLDAIVASRAERARVVRWVEQEGDDAGPWGLWGAVLCLALWEGTEGCEHIASLLESRPYEQPEDFVLPAEALLLSPHPEIPALIRTLIGSKSPLARAVAIEWQSRTTSLDSSALFPRLGEPLPVPIAALRALARLDAADREIQRQVCELLQHQDVDVSWQAARTLAFWGHPSPLLQIREGGDLCDRLGVRAIELLCLVGEAKDADPLQRIAGALPASRELLSALSRFGHPEVWAYLAHQLRNEELADDALAALRNLFGDIVPEPEEHSSGAWEQAVGQLGLPRQERICRGKPWTSSTVLALCQSGALHRLEVEMRLDELACRSGRTARVDLAHPWPLVAPLLAGLQATYGDPELTGWARP